MNTKKQFNFAYIHLQRSSWSFPKAIDVDTIELGARSPVTAQVPPEVPFARFLPRLSAFLAFSKAVTWLFLAGPICSFSVPRWKREEVRTPAKALPCASFQFPSFFQLFMDLPSTSILFHNNNNKVFLAFCICYHLWIQYFAIDFLPINLEPLFQKSVLGVRPFFRFQSLPSTFRFALGKGGAPFLTRVKHDLNNQIFLIRTFVLYFVAHNQLASLYLIGKLPHSVSALFFYFFSFCGRSRGEAFFQLDIF